MQPENLFGPNLQRRVEGHLASAMEFFQHTGQWFYRVRRKLATVGVGLLAIFLAFHVLFGPNGMVVYQKKKADYQTLQKDVERIQQQNQELGERIKALKSDPEAIEKEAREQLRYAKPGEVIYLLPGQKPDPSQANVSAQKR